MRVSIFALCVVAYAHPQRTTLAAFDVGTDRVTLRLHLPAGELDKVRPARLDEYLKLHTRPVAPDGRPWRVELTRVSTPAPDVDAELVLTPPAGASTRRFTLYYDAIVERAAAHTALVSVHSDWAGGQLQPSGAGVIARDPVSGRIAPLEIDLGQGSLWMGFERMLALGMEHIREGVDHLLFLLVLILPVTASARKLVRLIQIVSAFTVGHSITLLAGAAGWVHMPQRLVEVVIAFSILITAVHAIRPLFPGRESIIAAGFGLVHGLAFAAVLTDLKLSGTTLVLSILGFNLGIEMMQLLVIGVTVPWLILLSGTPLHRWARWVGAALAGAAAIAWMVNRVTGRWTWVEDWTAAASRAAPAMVAMLAVVAVANYFLARRPGRTA